MASQSRQKIRKVLTKFQVRFKQPLLLLKILLFPVLPSPPGKPDHEVVGNDITITWGPPAEGGYRALTEYRVEGGNKGQDWRILGTCVVSYYDKIQWDRKMKIFDFKKLHFNQVRVIAVNNDGESEPSESNVEI